MKDILFYMNENKELQSEVEEARDAMRHLRNKNAELLDEISALKEELEALKTAKSYLFSEQKKGGAWGMQRSGGAPGNEKTARDEMREQMFGK